MPVLNRTFIVAIDGPAGSGKTTVSRLVAEGLDFDYVDTGALYRGVALAAISAGVGFDDDEALDRLCLSLSIRLSRGSKGLHLWVNGVDVSDQIRTPQISMAASAVSARPVVRRYLLDLQRSLGHNRRAVFEGRDMGTVVFPQADIKFYLDADLETRAKRRHNEMGGDDPILFEEVKADMARRDLNDASRSIAPLKAAEDAIFVDTSDLTIDQVVEMIISRVLDRIDHQSAPSGDR